MQVQPQRQRTRLMPDADTREIRSRYIEALRRGMSVGDATAYANTGDESLLVQPAQKPKLKPSTAVSSRPGVMAFSDDDDKPIKQAAPAKTIVEAEQPAQMPPPITDASHVPDGFEEWPWHKLRALALALGAPATNRQDAVNGINALKKN